MRRGEDKWEGRTEEMDSSACFWGCTLVNCYSYYIVVNKQMNKQKEGYVSVIMERYY